MYEPDSFKWTGYLQPWNVFGADKTNGYDSDTIMQLRLHIVRGDNFDMSKWNLDAGTRFLHFWRSAFSFGFTELFLNDEHIHG
ncbi:hypothetical protein DICVIV_14047 [Dictyocaulus viviparus]|uniref:Uncharacterized protein n=1 Tax=Dictyocaulus viviparus TaxID=29172 RepID=A0A0D8X671_DICVI|nr:hypothetical protein DICVIV_14047 [Dictyocaulus viviparus]